MIVCLLQWMILYNNLLMEIVYFFLNQNLQHGWTVNRLHFLTHWGRMTHICVSKLNIIGSDNGLSPGWGQAIIWTNDEILLIEPLETNFNQIFIEIDTFSFKKIDLEMSSGKWRPFCLGVNMLILVRVQLTDANKDRIEMMMMTTTMMMMTTTMMVIIIIIIIITVINIIINIKNDIHSDNSWQV